MPTELKVFTVNVKSLDQIIDDPVVVGAGDANGRTFRLLFCQEAAAQFTENTKVYLKWYHQDKEISGYNVFQKVKSNPPIWEIKWPKGMLYKGNVLCTFELVDDISIAPSTTFTVHVLTDPHDGSDFTDSNDYTIFQKAVLDMNSLVGVTEEQLSQWADFLNKYQEQIQKLQDEKLDKVEFTEKIGEIPESVNIHQYISDMLTVEEF